MSDSMTHFYIPRQKQNEENLFIEEYYSSTDTKIFMDDIEQTEISYISYSLREQLKPIYGYASYTFDDMAIGNRIVTGAFKVPIKNADAQTQKEEIMKKYGLQSTDFIKEYNEEQDDSIESIEWISQKNNVVSKKAVENSENLEYKNKLIFLGYDLNYNSSSQNTIKQIKQFQKDNDIYEDGILTSETKNKIDQKLSEKNLSTIHIPADTRLYLNPSLNGSSFATADAQDAYVLNTLKDNKGNDIVYLALKSTGEEGYILSKGLDL